MTGKQQKYADLIKEMLGVNCRSHGKEKEMNEEQQQWSFEREGADFWDQEVYETEKDAIEEGRKWAKEKGLKQFVVGKYTNVPIPTELNIENVFNELDEQYYYDCGDPDADYAPFFESDRKENELAKKQLEEKLSKAIQEYVEETGITGRWYNVVEIKKIEVTPCE